MLFGMAAFMMQGKDKPPNFNATSLTKPIYYVRISAFSPFTHGAYILNGDSFGGFHLVRTQNFRDFRLPPSTLYAFHATYQYYRTQKLVISKWKPLV